MTTASERPIPNRELQVWTKDNPIIYRRCSRVGKCVVAAVTRIVKDATGEPTEIHNTILNPENHRFAADYQGADTRLWLNLLTFWTWYPYKSSSTGRRAGRRTRRNPIGHLKEGSLTKFGYHPTKTPATRHRAIRKAVRSYGPTSTFRKLNAVAVLTKRSSKGKSKTYKADRNWVKRTFMNR